MFRSMYFFKINRNALFVQSITNDDILAKNIRTYEIGAYVTRSISQQWSRQTQPASTSYSVFQEAVYRQPTVICWFKRATVSLINFPNSGQKGSAITGGFKRTMVLYMPRARQQSFYRTGFSCFRFQYNGLRYDSSLTAASFFCYL